MNSLKLGEPLRILLIDDEPSVLFALRLLMQACGHTVTDFNHPEEALSHISTCIKNKQVEFDLVVCDLKMPKKNGLMVLSDTRDLLPELPFVLMSAHATTTEQERAKALGVSGFLAKPFTPIQLAEVIKDLPLQEAV